MYESPINIIVNDIVKSLEEKQENYVMEYVQNIGVDVDKEELIRALQYDRNQYEKGYNDGLNANRWIPVSERLPEIHKDVLLSLRSLVVEVGFRAETEPYFYCAGGCYIEPQNVLAWMPLPESYKAERSDKE